MTTNVPQAQEDVMERLAKANPVPPLPETIAVVPAEIVVQRNAGWPDFHPETFCHRCGQRNVHSWWVERELWDAVQGDSYGGGILCPQCFTELYAAVVGKHHGWELRRT